MRRFFGVLLLAVLAGCAASHRLLSLDPKFEKQSVTPNSVVAPKHQTTAVAPALSKAKHSDNPKQLTGLDSQRVTDMLGGASFVRRDGTAEVWQYRAKACVLDIYLYKEVDVLTVKHFDLRKRPNATESPQRCFRKMLIQAH